MKSRTITACLAAVIAAGFLVDVRTAHADDDASRTAAKWLVDDIRGVLLRADSAFTLGELRLLDVWAQTACRICPDCPEAYLLRYRLLTLLDDFDKANEAQSHYCTLSPDDDTQRLVMLDDAFVRLRTAEDRTAFCQRLLAGGSLAPAIASELHRWLADLQFGVGDTTQAMQHLRESLRLYPFNFAARELGIAHVPGDQKRAASVGLLLASIASGATPAADMWALARMLDQAALHRHADEWYARAETHFGLENVAVPSQFLLDHARSRGDAGRYDQAAALVRKALQADPDSLDARFLLIDIARAAGQKDIAQTLLGQLRQRIAKLDSSTDAASAAKVAWYYTEYERQPEKALPAAKLAFDALSENAAVRRVYGMALLASGDTNAARDVLAPVATEQGADQRATLAYAEALLTLGDKDGAIAALRTGAELRRAGPAYDRITAKLTELGAARPPAIDTQSIKAALDNFDERLLAFHLQPAEYLSFECEPVESTVAFGAPIWFRFTLTNTGPTPLTLGRGQKVAGLVVVSCRIAGSTETAGDGAAGAPLGAVDLEIDLARKHMLAPGESVRFEQTISVGPLGDRLAVMPQHDAVVVVSAYLDPIPDGAGGRKSRLGSAFEISRTIEQPGMTFDASALRAVDDRLARGDATQRIAARKLLAGLLRERLAGLRRELSYKPPRIPKSECESRLVEGLSDRDPIARAACTRLLSRLPFDNQRAAAMAPLLGDAHWLVRMAAVHTLAEHQGTTFLPAATAFAEDETDALVAELASLWTQRLRAAEKATKSTQKR